MKKKMAAATMCMMLGMSMGCGSEGISADLGSTETVIAESESFSEKTMQIQETETASEGKAEKVLNEEDSTIDITGESRYLPNEEIEEIINNVGITFTTTDFEMTEEFETEIMPRLKEAIQYINGEWEEAANGNVTLTSITFNTGMLSNRNKTFRLDYTPEEQSDDFHFILVYQDGGTSRITKFWQGVDTGKREDIPVNPEISIQE